MLGVFDGLPSSQAAATEVDAAGYYELRCATCHGTKGEGTGDKSPSLGPPLRGNPLVINAPAEMLMSIIRRGRGGQQRVYDDAYPNMPAFDAAMVPDAIGLATYLKTVLQQQETANFKSGPAHPDSLGGEEVPEAPVQVIAPEAVDDGDAIHETARLLDTRHVDRSDPDRPTNADSVHQSAVPPTK
jgi:mono/diheme cytochrome c family protein